MHCVRMTQTRAVDRSSMSQRYQCQRKTRGYGPIRIRVTVKGDTSLQPERVEAATVEATPVEHSVSDISRGRTSKRALEAAAISARLSHAQELKKMSDEKVLLEEKNKCLENGLQASKRKLRYTQEMLRQCRNDHKLRKLGKQSAVTGDLQLLCQDIDKIFSKTFSRQTYVYN